MAGCPMPTRRAARVTFRSAINASKAISRFRSNKRRFVMSCPGSPAKANGVLKRIPMKWTQSITPIKRNKFENKSVNSIKLPDRDNRHRCGRFDQVAALALSRDPAEELVTALLGQG